MGITAHKRTGRITSPSLKTLRRLLKNLDVPALDLALATWVSVQVAVGRIAPGQVALAQDALPCGLAAPQPRRATGTRSRREGPTQALASPRSRALER